MMSNCCDTDANLQKIWATPTIKKSSTRGILPSFDWTIVTSSELTLTQFDQQISSIENSKLNIALFVEQGPSPID